MATVSVCVPIRVKAKDGKNGTDGVNAVRLDLDNENDTMLYDGHGTLLSGSVTSQASLYDGTVKKTSGVAYSCAAMGCTATISAKGVVTVTAMSADTGSVTVSAVYGGNTYTAVLTLKKLVGVDKYDIALSANSVKVSASGVATPSAITISVYRTAQNGSRTKLASLPVGYSLTVDGVTTLYSGSATLTPSKTATSHTVQLLYLNTVLDSETIPVVKDGADGDDADSHLLSTTGTSHDGTSSATGYVYVDGEEVKTVPNRGLTLSVYDTKTHAIAYYSTYDTYGDAANIDTLVAKLQEYHSGQYVVILTSFDAISTSEALTEELRSFGGGDTPTITRQRNALAFIGQYGLAEDTAYFSLKTTAGEAATVSATVLNGHLVPTGGKGDTGEKGDDGKGGWAWTFTPSVLTFETDKDGTLPSTLTGNAATLTVNVGGVSVTPTITKATGVRCSASYKTNGVTISSITTHTVDGIVVPYSSGYVTVEATATYGGVTQTFGGGLAFTVGVTAQMAQLTVAQDKISAKVTKVENGLDDANGDIDGLTESVGEIKTQAERISLTLKRTAVTGRNLLTGSMMRMVTQSDTSNHVMQAVLTKGKAYTLSAEAKVTAALANEGRNLSVFVFTSDWKQNAAVKFTETEWTVKSVTITPTATATFSVYACVCSNSTGTSSATTTAGAVGAVRWTMLEEGGVNTPWQGRDEDFYPKPDLAVADGWDCGGVETTAPLPDGDTGTCFYQSGALEYFVYTAGVFAVSARNTCTMSFWAKGGGTLLVKLDTGVCVGSMTSDGVVGFASDGQLSITTTSEWKRYAVTFTMAKSLSVNDTSAWIGVASGAAYIYEPRVERGGMATDGTLTNGLYATGIDIENKKMTVTADKFTVRDNSGNKVFYTEGGDTIFTGDIKCEGGTFGGMMRRSKTILKSSNYKKFIKENGISYYIDFTDLTPWIILDSSIPLSGTVEIALPYFYPTTYSTATKSKVMTYYGDDEELATMGYTLSDFLDGIRSLVGNRVMIYNNSGVTLEVSGVQTLESYLDSGEMYPVFDVTGTMTVENGWFLSAECVCLVRNKVEIVTSGGTQTSKAYRYGEAVIWVASCDKAMSFT